MTTPDHPAPFSVEIIESLRLLLPLAETRHVHDCYAGTGERLGELCDDLGLTFSGTDLAPAFIADKRVRLGDATKRSSYPRKPYVLATSPVYPNGIADDFHAQERCSKCKGRGVVVTSTGAYDRQGREITVSDTCEKCGGVGVRSHTRRTYRSWNAKLIGHDEPLHENNMGRWGYRGSKLTSPKRAMYWSLASRTIDCWTRATMALVNVSDFYADDRREPVVDGWASLLLEHGWQIKHVAEIETRRYRNGANREKRAEVESIIVALPPTKENP